MSRSVNVARWSLFEKREVESLSRVLTARTLDGYKVRIKLAVNFTRLLSEAETEALAQAYADAYRAVIEVEICEGRLPFDDVSLHRLLTERVQEVPPHRVRVNAAHVVSPGSASSASMPAVRAPVSGAPSAPPFRSVPVSRSVPASRTVSGFARSERNDPPGDSSFMRVAPAARAATSLAALGRELGHAVRSAAASLLLTAFRENESQLPDPLVIFEGGLDPAIAQELVQEACISMVYVLYRALTRAGIAEKPAIAVVQGAAGVALRSGMLPVADMSRYFATDMPAEELHKTFCRVLGIAGSESAEAALIERVQRLSLDAVACASSLQSSLRAVS